MSNSGHTTGEALLQRQLATPHPEPAQTDWTAAGARTYLYIADAKEMMDSKRRDCPWDRAQHELRLPCES
jgi:hypothetical protein